MTVDVMSRTLVESDSELETSSNSFKNISIMESINKLKSTEKEIVKEIKDCILLNDLLSIDDTDVISEYIEELTRFHREREDSDEKRWIQEMEEKAKSEKEQRDKVTR